MSSSYSTITNNVNLLLVNSSTITNYAPYVAYISSINVPGRIATVRDAVGLVSSPGRLIILSTLKDVLFSDGTSSITISQPFGYISLSSRDKNTWDIINTFAFPMPSPVSYVSSVYATDGIIANSYLSRTYISTPNLTTDSISSYRIQASTISTANLFSQNLRGLNNIFTSISSQTLSTNLLFANSISTNTTISQNVLISSLTLSNITTSASLTLSNDGQALLVNGIPTGTFRAVSTATTTLNMNNNSISNVSNLSSVNVTASNVLASNLQVNSISTVRLFADTISTVRLFADTISTNTLFATTTSTNRLFVNSISTINTNTKNINTSTITLFDAFTNTNINPINASNGEIYVNNQLNVTPYFTLTQGLINTSYLDNCNNNISNVNIATISRADIVNLRTDSISQYNNPNVTFCNNVNFNGNSISNVATLNTTTVTLTPNYSLSNSGADIISAAPQAFTNLLFPSVMNSLISRTTSNENNSIKTTTAQQKVWNIDFSVVGTTLNTNSLRTYFTLSNLTQNTEYSFDTYNSNYYLYIKPTTNNPTDGGQNDVLLHLRDTFRGTFNNNDLIYLNFYSSDNAGTNYFTNSILSVWFNPTSYDNSLTYTSVTYCDHSWVVGAANGAISYSTDNGTTFNAATSGLEYTGAIAYGRGLTIATGYSADRGPIFVSTDGGVNFDYTGVTGSFFDLSGHGIAYGNGVWVAVGMNSAGASSIIYSTDGYTWSAATGTTFSVGGLSVHFANNVFIAVGEGTNTILRSTNGSNWSTVGGSTFSGANIGYSVSYGYGRWYAGGDNKMYISDDNGLNWSDYGSSFFTGQKVLSIVVGEGILVGLVSNGISSLYYTSSNLNSFQSISVTPSRIYGLAYGNKRYMAVGNGDGILMNNAKNLLSYTLQPVAVQPP